MGSPAPLLLILTSYLMFVLKVGPMLMRDRKPIKLNGFLRCYNVFQIIACSYFIAWAYKRGFEIKSTWKCVRDKPGQEDLLDLCETNWKFIMLRLVELVETVVFVLRKKQKQISALHIYHHISTVTLLWTFLKYGMNEMGVYTCAVNSLVHIVMYSYYFLMTFKGLQSYLRKVKHFITIIQLVQLVLIFGNTIVALTPSCSLTKIYYLQVVNMMILIGFFTNFYVENYTERIWSKINAK